jgi:light-regulated signal transduction histidine kinase (bacteriophytochrome)
MISLSAMADDLMIMLLDETKKAKYQIEIQPNMFANCDLILMRICLQNLFENAIKFSAKVESPKIKFYISDAPSKVFCVEDNGVGFDADKASKLFTIFHRLHGEGEFPGLGIGLATVKKIVEIQGGSIWFESKLGHGAKFYFSLS